METLRSLDTDGNNIWIITELYWNQVGGVRVDKEASEVIQGKKGARQGCVLSPFLFNIYSKTLYREPLNEDTGITKLIDNIINNIDMTTVPLCWQMT